MISEGKPCSDFRTGCGRAEGRRRNRVRLGSMEPTLMVTEPGPKAAEERAASFAGALGADLRAIRAGRRRTILELLVVAGGALLLGFLVALFLAR